MSVSDFKRRIRVIQLKDADREWFPRWIDGYAKHMKMGVDDTITLEEPNVVAFLRSLRDNRYPAWRRLQAAKALECYQRYVIGDLRMCFVEIFQTLEKHARREEVSRSIGDEPIHSSDHDLVAGEGNPGKINQGEPEAVQRLRTRMRVLHHPKSTEESYAGWIRRLALFTSDDSLREFGEAGIGAFLTHLAIRAI